MERAFWEEKQGTEIIPLHMKAGCRSRGTRQWAQGLLDPTEPLTQKTVDADKGSGSFQTLGSQL